MDDGTWDAEKVIQIPKITAVNADNEHNEVSGIIYT